MDVARDELPAWVATLAPKTPQEAERAQRHARDYRIRMELVNGTRTGIHNERAAIIKENRPMVTEYEGVV